MKNNVNKPIVWSASVISMMLALLACIAPCNTKAAGFVKADNTTPLNTSGSWNTAGVPGSADTAIFDQTFSAANNSAPLGASMTWAGIVVSNNLQSAYTINADGSALTLGTGGINMSNANQSLTINCPVNLGGNEIWGVNAGQTLIFGGAINGGTATANNQYNLTTTGAGTINFNGNYSDTLNSFIQGQYILINSNTININPGETGSFVTAKKFIVGNIAGSTTTVNIQSGTNAFNQTNYFVMADNATATSILNIYGGQTTINNVNTSCALALKGTGVVNVANAVLIFGPSCRVAVGSDQSNGFTGADATLNINAGGKVIVTNSTQYFSLGNGGASSYGTGRLNLNSGGTLVCGRNIVKNQANAKGYITFNGGTLVIATNSATFLQGLTGVTNGANGVTIDDGGLAATIAQPLLHDASVTTDGGLIKLGAGTLTLSGTNTYNGTTTINAGSLAIAPAGAGAPGNYVLANGTTLKVRATTPADGMSINSMTLNAGSTLTLTITNASAPVINVVNDLTTASTVTLNIDINTTIVAGQYPLISYGTLGRAGFAGFVLGSTTTIPGMAFSLVNNSVNHSVDLLVGTSVPTLTWNGNLNGNWDLGSTANWQGGLAYTQPGGVGPIVTFNDTASGTTVLTLNTTVTPTKVVVNNGSLNYSIGGSGQIAGSGTLVKQGSGTLTLANANSFTNTTSIMEGTLQLGDGTAQNGSVGGNIIDNGTLVIANPNPQTMSNIISGGGFLTKSGAGTLTLTATNAVSGAVAINAGTLVLNQGGVGGSVPVLTSVPSVTIASGATLALAGTNALGLSNSAALPPVTISDGATLSATGSGSHSINYLTLASGTMAGSGTVVVNGSFTNTSPATISLGSLALNSPNVFITANSALNVNGGLNIFGGANSSTIITGDPGWDPGTVTTKGNITSTRTYVELEWVTWNVDLGNNSMTFNSKLTIGKQPGLPACMKWLSGTGLIAANDYFSIADSIGANSDSIGELDVSGGSLVISNNIARCLIGNAGTATINVSGGQLSFLGNSTIQLGGDSSYPQRNGSGTLTISDNGSVVIGPLSGGLRLAADKGTNSGISGTINLNGGTLMTWPGIVSGATGTGSSTVNFNGGTLKAGTNNAKFLQGLTLASVQAGGAVIDDGGNRIVIGQSLVDGGGNGGLTKLGSGTLILANTSTYTGTTLISSGAFEVDGGISSPVTVANGGALRGVGTLTGPVVIDAGGALNPGTNNANTDALGTLTINNNLTLNGSLLIGVNKSLAQSNSLVAVSGVLTSGATGTVIVTNLGPDLAVGDSFQLFNQPVLNGNTLSVSSGNGVTWVNNLAVDGSIQVLAITPAINPLPGACQFSLSGRTLMLSWPTNLGWILQEQTNSLSVGLSTNWVNVPGSSTVTNMSVNLTNGAAFYRLVHP